MTMQIKLSTFHALRTPALALLALLALVMGGCGSDDDDSTQAAPAATYDLSFSGTGFTPHEGQVLSAAVVRDSDGAVVARDAAVVNGGAFTFTFTDALTAGASYTLDYYADHSGDGVCDAPATDHVWRDSVGTVTGNETLPVTHTTSFTAAACDSFPRSDLTLSGTGFNPHAGQVITAALVRTLDGLVVGYRSALVDSGTNAFSLTFNGVKQAGLDYAVRYYADLNVNGVCDMPTTDHGWSESVTATTAAQTVDVGHTTNFDTAVCDDFPALNFTFTGDDTYAGPHGGQTVGFALVRDLDGLTVNSGTSTVDATTGDGVAFQFSYAGVLQPGVTYTAYYYADLSGNGTCDTPPTDHGWSTAAGPATAAVSLTDSHDTAFDTTACTYVP